jgi:hypothetical protein
MVGQMQNTVILKACLYRNILFSGIQRADNPLESMPQNLFLRRKGKTRERVE